MTKAIALIDGNNFYASCEKSLDASLINRPVVVLSNNDGCIIARSPEARNLGIPMGQPYFKVHHKLKELGVVVRSSNYALYGDMSQRLMKLIKENCEQIEIYSIDEAFVTLERPSHQDLRPWARQLRESINQSLGIPIAIGIGANKVQAKLANHLAKTIVINTGIFDLTITKDPDSWLENIAIEDVWGIGQKLARWCRIHGVNNARQLRDMPSNKLQSKYGIVGIRLQHELRGKSCLPLSIKPKNKKETCVSRSFGHPITNLEDLSQAIASHAVRAGEKLRQQKQLAGALTVFIRTSPFMPSFYSQSATRKLNNPTNDTTVLLKTALTLTKQIFQPSLHFIKAGVIMQQLQSTNYLQQDLLVSDTPNEQCQRDRLMNTIDKINNHYGNGTVSWAACGLNQQWGMRREQLSHASTTQITQIPIVNA